jgi:hypothetical protein
MLNLSKLNLKESSEKGFEIDLKHPGTGESVGATIVVVGSDGATYMAKVRELQRQHMHRVKRNPKASRSPQEIHDDAIQLVAACVTGWSGIEDDKGTIVFSEANAIKLFTDHQWIFEQVDAAINDRANFT